MSICNSDIATIQSFDSCDLRPDLLIHLLAIIRCGFDFDLIRSRHRLHQTHLSYPEHQTAAMEPRARVGKNRGQQNFSDQERKCCSYYCYPSLIVSSATLSLRPRRRPQFPRHHQKSPRRAPHRFHHRTLLRSSQICQSRWSSKDQARRH